MEAVATGLLAALNTYAEAIGAAGVEFAPRGALGALVGYATDPATVGYQPCMSTLAWCRHSRMVSAAASATATRPMRTVRSRPLMPIWPLAPICLEATGHSL